MTNQLLVILERFLITRGKGAKAILARAALVDPKTISNYLTGKTEPTPARAYELAIACGVKHTSALRIAQAQRARNEYGNEQPGA